MITKTVRSTFPCCGKVIYLPTHFSRRHAERIRRRRCPRCKVWWVAHISQASGVLMPGVERLKVWSVKWEPEPAVKG